jgi:DNA mismatch repair protein MutL
MGKIKKLDSSIYNRLAAGEVVENPASIVKELVENSIDAGAKHIIVTVYDGGIKSISVIDDGCGIEKDDLILTVASHATSKISTAEDLETISTLGFRGEALASIAAVSRIELKSRFITDDKANFIIVKGGETIDSGVCALAGGTNITVSSLFFNTPARFKFLKMPKGEESAVTKLMAELLLSNPEISFKYVADGETVYYTNGSGLENVLMTIFGREICDNLIPFRISEKNYTVGGYVGRPATDAVLGNKSKQVYIVNGRIFNDITLPAVVQNAYGEKLMRRTFPVAVVDIVMPFDLVDINVHPNKKEVRFAEKKLLIGLLYSAIKAAVEKDERDRETELSDNLGFSEDKNTDLGRTQKLVAEAAEKRLSEEAAQKSEGMAKIKRYMDKFGIENNQSIVKSDSVTSPIKANPPTIMSLDEKDEKMFEGVPPQIMAQIARNPFQKKINFHDSYQPKYVDTDEEKQEAETLSGMVAAGIAPVSDANEPIGYKTVGQAFDTYLIVESGDELFFIDQHAAHERILYNNLLAQCEKRVEVQSFLIPYMRKLTYDEAAVFENNRENLKKLGFDITVNGESLAITSVPCLLVDINIDDFVTSVAQNCVDMKKLSDIDAIKSKFATLACKSAIKGGDKLTDDQIRYVLKYFFDSGMPLQCPHGRPTVIKFKKTEIEKMFGRIVG